MLIVFMLVAFASGHYLSRHSASSGTEASDKHDTSRQVIIKKSGPLTAGEIAEAKESLIKALHTPSRLGKWHALQDYVATLDTDMAKALINDLNKQGLTPEDNLALTCLMHRWAELDPQAAIAWVLKGADPDKKELCTEAVFNAFSAHDPAAALAALAQFRGQVGANYAINIIFKNYAQQNPQAALAALQGLPPGQRSSNLYFEIFSGWVDQNPAAAAAAAANLASGAARNQSLDVIASNWARQDPSASLAWAVRPSWRNVMAFPIHAFRR